MPSADGNASPILRAAIRPEAAIRFAEPALKGELTFISSGAFGVLSAKAAEKRSP